MNNAQALIIKDLNFRYPDGTQALKNINIEVKQDESIGIIGPNGAGKSTLLLHANGILNGGGNVRVFGLDMARENLKLIRKKVGFVFQNPDDQLFMPTVFDDVAFGPLNMRLKPPEVEQLVDKALDTVEMGYAKERSSHHLSLGEKKRISIATVLAMNPELLILDEPTSNLDPRSRKDLIDFLEKLAITKIIASHDLRFIDRLCGRVILMYEGRIIKDGTKDEILKDKGIMESGGLEVL